VRSRLALIDRSLARFLREVARGSPTPGGGSAAALAGSLAAALVAMVCELTLGKRGYEAVEGEMRGGLARAALLRDELAELIEEDIQAFDRVMAAHRLPRGERGRAEALEAALKRATKVPLETAERCLKVLELAELAAAKGNKNALSDAGTAGWLARAGLEAALLNVAANLSSIEDEAFRREGERRREELALQGRAHHERLLGYLEGRR